MDQLACMRIFVRVVEHGAFVRAADNLNTSRASVTTAVAQLEQRLGVRLLNRTTRRLGLTEEGKPITRIACAFWVRSRKPKTTSPAGAHCPVVACGCRSPSPSCPWRSLRILRNSWRATPISRWM
ncbi:LysR family transcriptional regulator [Pseudomonas lalucatii]|nr:LysR family transcriptional regulator [Pseudomonas lalucatii]